MLPKLFVAVSLVALMGQGCPTFSRAPSVQPLQAPEAMMPKEEPAKNEEAMMPKEETKMMKAEEALKDDGGSAMIETNTTYQPYTKSAYEAAKLAGKPIFLFFYANWCPTCREQDPRLQTVVPQHKGGVVGFRVNFKDTETDADETALAKEFGVPYQHTGFFIGKDGVVKQKTIGTISDTKTLEYLDLISK